MQAMRAQLSRQRWHFQHGPIDLILSANGEPCAIAQAIENCWQRFQSVLTELVGQLPQLRAACRPAASDAWGDSLIAHRMHKATLPFVPQFITPMAAVAGAVADEMIGFFAIPGIERAFINNGGDIALMLGLGQSYRIGLASEKVHLSELERLVIDQSGPVRGIASSGWRGRSFSLGIADSVTTLAGNAASADAAATMIGNAVNIDDQRIRRRRASDLKDDSDLGELLVTVGVPVLSAKSVGEALERGASYARQLLERGLIEAALLKLQNQTRVILAPPFATHSNAVSLFSDQAALADLLA